MSSLRLALRTLAKSPGFSLIAIVTLALGIGMNTSMFSILNTVLLQEVRLPEADNTLRVFRTTPQSQNEPVSVATFLELERNSAEFARLGAFRWWTFTLTEPGVPATLLNAIRVTDGFLDTVGVQPELGRGFTKEENLPGQNNVVILSHAAWQEYFGGAPDIVGRTISLDTAPVTIVGVMPKSFREPRLWGPAEVMRPVGFTNEEQQSFRQSNLNVFARGLAGVSPEQLGARLQTVHAAIARDHAGEVGQDGLRAVTLSEAVRDDISAQLSGMLIGLSGFVLLIGCANLANLQLARAISRAREFAVRSALGASRSWLVRPIVSECLVLALVGGAFGIVIAYWCNAWIRSQVVPENPEDFALALDWRVLGFAFFVSIATGLLFGLVPALLSTRVRVNEILKSGSRGMAGDRSHNRFRSILIVAQFGLALMLLCGAGLFLRGLDRILEKERGWNLDGAALGTIALSDTVYPDAAQMYSFYERLEERLRAIPGVEQATIAWRLPHFGFGVRNHYVVEGRDPPARGQEPLAFVNGIMPSYLAATGISMRAGRPFDSTDRLDSPLVVLINESMANAVFPGENPVGRRIGVVDAASRQWMEIVGVIADIESLDLMPPDTRFQIYRPLAQETWGYVNVALRGKVPDTSLLQPFRQAVEQLDPNLPIRDLSTYAAALERANRGFHVVNQILTALAALGLFLASLGIYGVIARTVAQRTPEIGIRMALGAQGSNILALFLTLGGRLALVGVVLGVAGAFGLNRVIVAILPLFPTLEGWVIASLAVGLVAIGLLACYLPARRALKISPIDALRVD